MHSKVVRSASVKSQSLLKSAIEALEDRKLFAVAPININFQPSAATAVQGYKIDAGLPFASRNGLQYGWSVSHADSVFDRNANQNRVVETHAAIKQGAKCELSGPNGKYDVKVSVGYAKAV